MENVEKEGGLPVFHTDILNAFFFFFFFFFFLPTAEITARITGKISTNLPVAEGLISDHLESFYTSDSKTPTVINQESVNV